MITQIKQWLAPPIFEDDEKTQQARNLNIIILALLFTSTLLFVNNIPTSPAEFIIGDFILAGSIVIELFVWALLRRRYLALPSIIVSLMVLGAITSFLLFGGSDGIRSHVIIVYFIGIVVSGLILGRLGLLTAIAITVLGLISAYVLEVQGRIVPSMPEPIDSLTLTSILILMGLAFLALYVLVDQNVRNMTRLRRNQQELLDSNEELQTIRASLEARVAARTKNLEAVASLSEKLNSILDLEQLLIELVNQVKEIFDYYHVHVYLLDEPQKRLVLAEGTGSAGATMKAKDHAIALDQFASLVVRAFQTRQVILSNNVRSDINWLPNELLPETQSEMAVPIILEGRIVGVLDVQQNKVGSLGEDDEDLLRSLSSQVAVAIRNSRLFHDVETALTLARQTQDKYTETAWKASEAAHTSYQQENMYVGPNAPVLDKSMFDKAAQTALTFNRPELVEFDEDQSKVISMVAPIHLGNTTIGTFQLHNANFANPEEKWTEHDMALVETILGQVAQVAENMRLFDETRQQANYEHLLTEVTQKLRQAPNFEILAKTAAEALGDALEMSDVVVRLNVSENLHTSGTNGHV